MLLQSIEKSQLRTIVQIVYNVMFGYCMLSEKDKKTLIKHKTVLRQFVIKGLSLKREKGKELFLEYYKSVLLLVNVIKKSTFITWLVNWCSYLKLNTNIC